MTNFSWDLKIRSVLFAHQNAQCELGTWFPYRFSTLVGCYDTIFARHCNNGSKLPRSTQWCVLIGSTPLRLTPPWTAHKFQTNFKPGRKQSAQWGSYECIMSRSSKPFSRWQHRKNFGCQRVHFRLLYNFSLFRT